MKRRIFLDSMAASLLLAAAGMGRLLAAVAQVPVASGAFQKALAATLGRRNWAPSDQIAVELPQLAENGAIVPITVESRLPGTERILIFAEKNPGPLLAEFRFEPGTDAWVALRLKLNDSGPVLAIAESGGKFYGTEKSVKVMMGGCG